MSVMPLRDNKSRCFQALLETISSSSSHLLKAVVLVGLVATACTSEPTDTVAEPARSLLPAPSTRPVGATTTTATPAQPTAAALPATAGCGPARNQYKFEVVDVAPDDPDGGLITHAGPGVETPELGVFAWDSGNIRYLDCAVASNGSAWWQVSVGSEAVWVNSRYLGDRRIVADSLVETPCSREQSTVLPAGGEGADTGAVIVADIDVESSAGCDRVVIEMAEGFDGFDSIVTSLRPDFGADFVGGITQTGSEIQVELVEVELFASGVDVESWRDVATGEQNVALLMEDYETGSTLYIGWGTGEAFLRFAQEPTPRIIIDIFQAPTPPNQIAGPIVGAAVLFDPIQTDRVSPGVKVPITVRGWSRGFEASSVLKLATWDERNNPSPLDWEGELFGRDATTVFTSGVEFAKPLQDFDVPYWPFMTTGYFEITITDISVGSYQLAIEPSSGCRSSGGTGQQFRVIDDDAAEQADYPHALPFSIEHRWVGDDFEKSQTVTSVLGFEALGPVTDAQC